MLRKHVGANQFGLIFSEKEQLEEFRRERIQDIKKKKLPFIGRYVIHLIPASSLCSCCRYVQPCKYDCVLDVEKISQNRPNVGFDPNSHYNQDGVLWQANRGYLQWFRDGVIELVFTYDDIRGTDVPSGLFEKEFVKNTLQCLDKMKSMALEPPIYLFLSMVSFKGYTMAMYRGSGSQCDDEDILPFPVIVEQYPLDEETLRVQIQPQINFIWNAFGYPKSLIMEQIK